MKTCTYCGSENQSSAAYCRGCGLNLPCDVESEKPPPTSPPRLIEPDVFSQAIAFSDGFHFVEWRTILDWIESQVASADQEAAWNEALLMWAGTLRDDLGGNYVVAASPSAILLSELDPQTAKWLLDYTDRSVGTIKTYLGETAWGSTIGKHVLFIFSEEDDYYQYVSHFDQEGEHAGSGGMCIHSGYTHIAIPWHDELQAANVLAHELTHDCVGHLLLPLWLDEGVAVILEKAIAPSPRSTGEGDQQAVFRATLNWQPPVMWDELAERHFAFWNERNIQSFWAGTSFVEPGESSALSYSLAEVFVTLLAQRGREGALRAYLEKATREDAGQAAAFEVFGTDLGETAKTFLGEGNWSPQRTEMIKRWEEAGWRARAEEPPTEPWSSGSNWVPSE